GTWAGTPISQRTAQPGPGPATTRLGTATDRVPHPAASSHARACVCTDALARPCSGHGAVAGHHRGAAGRLQRPASQQALTHYRQDASCPLDNGRVNHLAIQLEGGRTGALVFLDDPLCPFLLLGGRRISSVNHTDLSRVNTQHTRKPHIANLHGNR